MIWLCRLPVCGFQVVKVLVTVGLLEEMFRRVQGIPLFSCWFVRFSVNWDVRAVEFRILRDFQV